MASFVNKLEKILSPGKSTRRQAGWKVWWGKREALICRLCFFKPSNHNEVQQEKWHFLLRVQKPVPLGSGGEATPQSEFPSLGKSEHRSLPGSCCGTGEGNSGVIQGSVFPQKFNDFSLTPTITPPIRFILITPPELHGWEWQAAFFLGLTPQTCPKTLHVPGAALPGYRFTSFPTKPQPSFLKLRPPLKNCPGASHFSSPSPMQFIPYILCLFLCLWFTHLFL